MKFKTNEKFSVGFHINNELLKAFVALRQRLHESQINNIRRNQLSNHCVNTIYP